MRTPKNSSHLPRETTPTRPILVESINGWKLPDEWIQVLAILLGFGVVCGFHSPPLTGDFKVYLSTAMEMREMGEWIHPKLYGASSYFKPPFQYWMTLLGWKTFGYGNFGAYFPSVLALSLTAWLIGRVSRFFRKQSQVDSWVCAGLWFAGNVASMCYGTVTQMEVWVTLFSVFGAWLVLTSFYQNDGSPRRCADPNWLWLSLFFALSGISAWIKSPIYSIFSVASLWLFLYFTKNREIFRSYRFYLLHGLGGLIGLSWYFLVWYTDRDAFVARYVQLESLNKLSGNGISVFQILWDFSLWCAPLSIFLWVFVAIHFSPRLGFRRSVSEKLERLRQPRNAWLLAHLLPPLIFFLSFPYRLEAYLYIGLPYLALMMEWDLPRLRGVRWVAGFTGVTFGIIFLLVGLAFTQSKMLSLFTGGLVCLTSLYFLFLGARFLTLKSFDSLWVKMAWGSFALIVALRWGAASLGERDVEFLRLFMNQHSRSSIGMYDPGHDIWHERSHLGVTVGKVAHFVDQPQMAIDFLNSGGVLILNDSFAQTVVPVLKGFFQNRAMNGATSHLREENWLRPKRAFYLPTWSAIKMLASRNDSQWVSKFMKEYKILYLED